MSGPKLAIVDDAAGNLAPARRLNWRTVWVSHEPKPGPDGADYTVNDLWQIAGAFQELGLMDKRHRAVAEHRLAGCAWAKQG